LYADAAIACALVVKVVFHLSLRATQGFLESVVRLMGVELPVPDYTTVCRRQAGLEIGLSLTPRDGPCHVVIDTTGLKVLGAGGWYVRKHGMGRGRRRTWRKLHLGVDETTKEIVAVDLTTSGVHDGPHFPALLEQVVGTVGQVSGDRVYDSGTCYEAILARHATPTIPPRRKQCAAESCQGPATSSAGARRSVAPHQVRRAIRPAHGKRSHAAEPGR
jgi:IS5 family transposase